MKKLLKVYGFTSNEQYYDMVLESLVNGQRTQAREQFKAMPRDNRKEMVMYVNHNPVSDNATFFFQEL